MSFIDFLLRLDVCCFVSKVFWNNEKFRVLFRRPTHKAVDTTSQ